MEEHTENKAAEPLLNEDSMQEIMKIASTLLSQMGGAPSGAPSAPAAASGEKPPAAPAAAPGNVAAALPAFLSAYGGKLEPEMQNRMNLISAAMPFVASPMDGHIRHAVSLARMAYAAQGLLKSFHTGGTTNV